MLTCDDVFGGYHTAALAQPRRRREADGGTSERAAMSDQIEFMEKQTIPADETVITAKRNELLELGFRLISEDEHSMKFVTSPNVGAPRAIEVIIEQHGNGKK
jgi:hypothetical protein